MLYQFQKEIDRLKFLIDELRKENIAKEVIYNFFENSFFNFKNLSFLLGKGKIISY